jgi:NAD-dependent dihydropyrimidine dehydrogenase PreA subunit
MKRTIITIDEIKCDGCGECVEGCHEGALQMIDGKARLVSELYCDGLGACLGTCHTGAIKLEEKEAEPYSETAVMERISKNGEKVILAHLKHLKDHGEEVFLEEGISYIKNHNIKVNLGSLFKTELTVLDPSPVSHHSGCPGSREVSFDGGEESQCNVNTGKKTELTHWPIQLHLINPQAEHFKCADIVLAADCSSFSISDFHGRFLKGKKLIIACPKLDSNKEVYIEKIKTMIDSAMINTLTVVIMEVPCCGGLIRIAELASESAVRKVPIRIVVIGIKGDILKDEWL